MPWGPTEEQGQNKEVNKKNSLSLDFIFDFSTTLKELQLGQK